MGFFIIPPLDIASARSCCCLLTFAKYRSDLKASTSSVLWISSPSASSGGHVCCCLVHCLGGGSHYTCIWVQLLKQPNIFPLRVSPNYQVSSSSKKVSLSSPHSPSQREMLIALSPCQHPQKCRSDRQPSTTESELAQIPNQTVKSFPIPLSANTKNTRQSPQKRGLWDT